MNTYFRKVIFLAIIAFSFLAVFSGDSVQKATSAQNCVEPPSGLVSWWNGSRKQPTNTSKYTALDISDGNNGTIISQSSSPYEHPGKVGEAFRFGEETTADFRGIITRNPAKNLHVGINPANLNFGAGQFSLEAWFKWESGSKSSINNIIRKSLTAYKYNRDNGSYTSYGTGYWLRISRDTKLLEFFTGDTGDDPAKPRGLITAPISSGVWYHVIATRNTSGIMRLYLDGELKGTKEASYANTTSESPFGIGGWQNELDGYPTETFKGLIDEISVYNKELSQSEVRAIFNAGSAGKCLPSITPEPSQSPTPTPSKTPTPTPTKSPIPKVLSTITYPVADLGNCTSYEDCKTYCGVSTNYAKCITYAQKIGLEVEIPSDKKDVFEAMQKGKSPGQCKDEVSCRNYCGNTDNIGECADFADKFNLVTPDELKEMRQIANAKKAGVPFPGNCKTKESCLKYCDNSANAAVCIEFAQKAGFIPKEDAEAVGKILPYLKSGGKLPGGCTTKESCGTYCDDDSHTTECVDFALGVGFMTKEDADIMKKTGGKSPGNCRSREACDGYCKDATHTDECIDFAVKAGFVSKEDAEMAKKYKITSGPGNCKGKAECEAFCVLPENQETCFNFAKDHGMLSKEDLKNIEEQKKFLESIGKASPEWLACMEKELGSEFFGRFKAGKLTQAEAKSPALETTQRKCGSEKVQGKIDVCLSGSCSEFDACMKALEQIGDEQDGQQQKQSAPDPKVNEKIQACQQEKINACLAKSCGEFQACINALGGSGGEQQSGTPDPAVMAKFKTCNPPKQSGPQQQSPPDDSQPPQSGDQSQIPQGYSSWEAFCRAQIDDSRCSAYKPQIPQYPLLIEQSFLGAIFRYLLK